MKLDIVILAAGEGKRMQSALPKVLHRVGGIPLLQHVIDSADALAPVACHVVVGHGSEQVRECFAQRQLTWVLQGEQLGTGHAVMQALPAIDDDATVLVLYGDVPLISADTLKGLLAQGRKREAQEIARRALDAAQFLGHAKYELIARATLADKLRMLETLLDGDEDADREAALVILRAANVAERRELATRIG